MSKLEKFSLPTRELRVQPNADGSRTVVGVIPYDSPSAGLPWDERIAPGAFADALKAGADVLCLRDHDTSLLLGRTLAGTLTLTDSSIGLTFRCKLPNTTTAADLIESLSRGDISGVSFGFSCNKDQWTDNGAGNLTRTLLSVSLFEVSVVSFPAFPDSSAALRSLPKTLRPLLKRSNADGCDCDCDSCVDGNCEECENENCQDVECAANGCKSQDEDEERSGLANLRLLVEVAKRR